MKWTSLWMSWTEHSMGSYRKVRKAKMRSSSVCFETNRATSILYSPFIFK